MEFHTTTKSNYVSPFAKLWMDESMRISLIERIQERQKDKNQISKIREKNIIEEYFRVSQTISEEDKIKALIHQVGLLKVDLDKVQEITQNSKQSQLKWGVITTSATYMVYKLFLAKRKTFYNYFRKTYRYPFLGHLKRGFTLFGVFVLQVNLLNLSFDKIIPTDLHKEGLFKKYYLEFDKVYL